MYDTNFSTFRDHLSSEWVVDTDPFATNLFLHPYQGSIHYGFPQSAGLNFWESLGYAVVGSFLWETAGETGPPSGNDQITTPSAGVSWANRSYGWPAASPRRDSSRSASC